MRKAWLEAVLQENARRRDSLEQTHAVELLRLSKQFGDFTMKGEPGVDKNWEGQHDASWQSGDTWPNLQNPYSPKSDTPKVNHGKEADMV